MLISLIICTYNRAELLEYTLPFLNEIDFYQDSTLELIIVDNNSSDGTKVIAEKFIRDSHSSLNSLYVFEEKQGLSHARNTGYKSASGDYIAYIDDECILSKNWMIKAIESIKANKPAFVGGPYYGKYFPGDESVWFKESLGDSYLIEHKLPVGPIGKHYLSGGNMIIRRDVFEKIGLFDPYFGMSGNTVAYGEEVDFQIRFIKKYPSECIWYDPDLYVRHCVRKEKMSIKYLFEDALRRGYTSAELKQSTFKKVKFSPVMLAYFSVRAVSSTIMKFIKSLVTPNHFLTLLSEDYKNGTWSDIGRAWFRTKFLIRKILH